MKAIVYIILLTLHSLTILGQNRIIDIRVEFTNIQDGDTVYSPSIIPITYSVLNQGPDTLHPTDTFVSGLGHSDYDDFTRKRRALGTNLAPGQSIMYTDSVPINSTESFSTLRIAFGGGAVGFYSPRSVPRIIQSEFSEEQKDNYPTATVIHIRKTTSTPALPDVDWRLYPNPVPRGGQIYIEASSTTSSRATILSAIGKKIVEIELKGNKITLPSTMKTGSYILQIQMADVLTTKKLIVIDP